MKLETIDAQNIDFVLSHFSGETRRRAGLLDRYRSKGLPIQSREYVVGGEVQSNKINNKLNNDFFKEIVDVKVGYLCGIPVSITYGGDDEATADVVGTLVKSFQNRNSFPDVFSDAVRTASVTGLGVIRLYVDADANIRCESLPSSQCLFFDDKAVHFYTTETIVGDSVIVTERFDAYDRTNVTRYEKIAGSKAGKKASWRMVESKPHMFRDVPLVMIWNNENLSGDAENVLELIDAYDRVMSDVTNELEQFRLAYLIFNGFVPGDDDIKKLYSTGAMYMPDPSCGASFLIKPIPVEAVDWALKKLEANIYAFSGTPNLRQENFAGNSSGVALEYLYRSFEAKCKTSERSYGYSLREMFKLVCGYWNFLHGTNVDYLDFKFGFTRNLPRNLLEESQIQMNLKGLVADKTRLSLFSPIENVDDEIEAMEADGELVTELARNLMNKNGGATA